MTTPQALERAARFTPVLRERSAGANRERRVQAETIRELLDAGLFKLLQPRRYGGVEAELETFVKVAIQLARGCGSAGWVFSVLSIHQWMLGMYEDQAQADVWAKNPDALIASALRPSGKVTKEKGGLRISGEWGFASGIDNSDWIILGAFCGMKETTPPRPDVRMILVPLSDGKIVDNWHVMGLRGTGSKTFVLDNAFVPEHRQLDFMEAKEAETPGRSVNSGPLYRMPAFANFPVCLAGPGVGAGWGAYDRFVEYARVRKNIAQKTIADFPTVQMRVAEAASMLDAAEQLLLRYARESYGFAVANEKPPIELRARWRRDQCWAPKTSAEAAEKLLRACGGQGLFDDFEIQRCYRDAYATAAHIGTSWDVASTMFGAVTLGVAHPEPLSWI